MHDKTDIICELAGVSAQLFALSQTFEGGKSLLPGNVLQDAIFSVHLYLERIREDMEKI